MLRVEQSLTLVLQKCLPEENLSDSGLMEILTTSLNCPSARGHHGLY